MKLIEPKVELIPQEPGLDGIYKQIELAGRTCYRSQDKITEDSAKKFTGMLIKNGHGAMLEHATVYLYFPYVSLGRHVARYSNNKYSKRVFFSNVIVANIPRTKVPKYIPIRYGKAGQYVTTNLRVLVENNWLDDLKYLCKPTKYHEKRYTFRFTTNIGVSREFNRHRVNSIAEESTRFCGYNKDKFGSEITYIQPRQFDDEDIINFTEEWDPTNKRVEDNQILLKSLCSSIAFNDNMDWKDIDYWMFAMLSAEYSYMGLINQGWKPQDARCALNLNTKTELVHTAFESDWKHFCELRCSPAAHPEAQVLANQIKDVLKIEL